MDYRPAERPGTWVPCRIEGPRWRDYAKDPSNHTGPAPVILGMWLHPDRPSMVLVELTRYHGSSAPVIATRELELRPITDFYEVTP